jgi:hypothetical protein
MEEQGQPAKPQRTGCRLPNDKVLYKDKDIRT